MQGLHELTLHSTMTLLHNSMLANPKSPSNTNLTHHGASPGHTHCGHRRVTRAAGHHRITHTAGHRRVTHTMGHCAAGARPAVLAQCALWGHGRLCWHSVHCGAVAGCEHPPKNKCLSVCEHTSKCNAKYIIMHWSECVEVASISLATEDKSRSVHAMEEKSRSVATEEKSTSCGYVPTCTRATRAICMIGAIYFICISSSTAGPIE